MLTQDQIAYGQQKNREHCWNQAKQERIEYKKFIANALKKDIERWYPWDERAVEIRYEELCELAKITPW